MGTSEPAAGILIVPVPTSSFADSSKSEPFANDMSASSSTPVAKARPEPAAVAEDDDEDEVSVRPLDGSPTPASSGITAAAATVATMPNPTFFLDSEMLSTGARHAAHTWLRGGLVETWLMPEEQQAAHALWRQGKSSVSVVVRMPHSSHSPVPWAAAAAAVEPKLRVPARSSGLGVEGGESASDNSLSRASARAAARPSFSFSAPSSTMSSMSKWKSVVDDIEASSPG